MPNIKNIFLDFGRTIVEHPEDGAGLRIVKATGVTDEADIELIRNEIFSVEKYLNDLDDGSLAWDEYERRIAEAMPVRLRKFAIEAARYKVTELPLIDGMEDLIKKLKADGFRIYITSNLNENLAKGLMETSLVKYFDDTLFSVHVKTRKPYKEFFEAAFEKFDVLPEETIFIDDLEENVEGAKKCGIHGFVFNGDAKAAEEFIYKTAML